MTKATILLLLLLGGCAHTTWVGKVVINDDNPWTPSYKWLHCADLGLRSDGIVVWKLSKQDKCK